MSASSPAESPIAATRLIVVDDDRDGAASLCALLEAHGYTVRSVHDGLHALALIQQWQPRCVLLDIDLPGIDGFDIARRLRRQDPRRETMLIATSGWSRPEDVETAAVCGIDHFLPKPIDADSLLALLPGP